jgi:hypothetical protein
MAWKKIVVQGSAAELSNINVTNAVTASAFVGDGSALTNLPASAGVISSSVQIEALLLNNDVTFGSGDVTATQFIGDGSQLTDVTVDQNATVANTFTNATTASVTHNFNSPNVTAVIYDDNNEQFIPATVRLVNDNQLDVYMDPAQTGRVIAIRGGHIVSGSIPYANIIAKPTTLAGYGITDARTATVVDGKLQKSLNFSDISDLAVSLANLGLDNVDNTADTGKPVSTAQQSALNLKANLADPALTGNPTAPTQADNDNSTKIATTAFVQREVSDLVGGAGAAFDTLLEISASIANGDSDVVALTTVVGGKLQKDQNLGDLTDASAARTNIGLGNVDNTTDALKPVSTAGQTALDLKANIASPTFTGTVSGVTKAMVGLTNADDTSDANKPVSTAGQTALDLKANIASPTFTGTVSGVTKAMVGLTNADDTSDANKPVSTAGQAALDLKANIAQLNVSSSQLTDAYKIADSTLSSSLAASISAVSSDFTLSDGSATDTFTTGQTLTFAGTANEIETAVTNNQVQVGIVTNPTLTGNVTITGNLNITGDTIQAQVSNLNVEDRFILLNSGSASGDAGIVFGGAGGSTANTGDGIFYKDSDSVFAYGEDIASTATTATAASKLGNIQVASSNPTAAPTFQGKGTIAVNDSDEGIWIYS